MSSIVPYVKGGRTRQKTRTMEALVETARQLMGQGVTPTVEEAAAEAGVSRATAYRYFPNQRSLLVASYPMIERASLLPEDAPSDVEERVVLVARRILESVVENETALRAQLRMSLDPADEPHELPLRKGRRITWFKDALSPWRSELDARSFDRLTRALAAFVSLEVLIWLVDLAGLSRKQAVEEMIWTSRHLLSGARSTSA